MRLFRSLVLVLAGIVALIDAHPNQKILQAPIVFAHVNVIDTANSSLQPDMTVVIVSDHITDVGKAKDTKVRSTARVIDGRGKFLIPGLWDMHVHTFTHDPRFTRTWFFPLFIANGITGVRDMWTTGDDFPQVVKLRAGLADSSLLVPRYAAVGWLVDGPDPIWPNSTVVSTPQEARHFVRKVKASGVDFVKVYWQLRREEYLAIAAESKKLGIPFAGHVPFIVSAAEASDAGQKSIEHLTNVDIGCSTREKELLPVPANMWGPEQDKETLETYDRLKCEQLLRKFAHNQTWQVPTSWMFFEGRASLRDHFATDARSKYVPANVRADWQQEGASPWTGLPPINDHSSERLELEHRKRRQTLAVIALMNKAGVPLMAGTDLGNAFVLPGFNLHDELALFVQAGLTPGEALKTATYNPAKFLGLLDRLGMVEKGKLADLVLLDENPLEDIHNTQKIRAVVLNGKYLDRAALDQVLADAASNASTH